MAKNHVKAAQDNAGLNVDGMGLLGGQNAIQQSPIAGLPGIGNAPTHLGPMSSKFPYAGAASVAGGEGQQNPYMGSANIGGAGMEDIQASINQLNQSNQTAFPAVNKYAAQDSNKSQQSSTGEDNGVSFKTRDEDHATGTDAWASLGKYVKTGGVLRNVAKMAKPPKPGGLKGNRVALGAFGGLRAIFPPGNAALGMPKNLGRNPQRPEGTPGHFRWDSTVDDGDVWSDPSGLRQDGTP